MKETNKTVTRVVLAILIMGGSTCLLWASGLSVWAALAFGVFIGTMGLFLYVVNQRLQQLLLYRTMEDSGVFTAALDDAMTVLYANDRFGGLMGVMPENLRGQSLLECVHPNSQKLLLTFLEQMRQGERTCFETTIRVPVLGGGERFIMLHGSVKQEDKYDSAVIQGVGLDVTAQKETEHTLALQKQLLETALSETYLRIWVYNYADRTARFVNESAESAPLPEVMENVPDSLAPWVHPEDRGAFLQMYADLAKGQQRAEGVFRIRDKEDEPYHYNQLRYVNLFDDEGKPCEAVGIADDVTAEYETAAFYRREMYYRQMAAADMYAIFILNVTTQTVLDVQSKETLEVERFTNVDFKTFFRRQAALVADDEGVREYFSGLTPEAVEARMGGSFEKVSFEYRRIMPDGEPRWVSYEGRVMVDPDGDIMEFAYLKDIDAIKRREQELENAAETDAMTGLYNHATVIDQVKRYLQMEGRMGTHALFVIDVDDFKSVNDKMGHRQGDDVLVQMSRAIQGCFRSTDVVGRIGGDEFLALMKNVTSLDMVHRRGKLLVEALQFESSTEDVSLQVSGSVGIAIYTGDCPSYEELFKQADEALYGVKRSGKNDYRLVGGEVLAQEQKAGEDAAERVSTIQYRALLEYLDAGVMLLEIGEQIRPLYVSPGYYKMVRLAPEQYDGENSPAMLVEDNKAEMVEQLRHCASTGQPVDIVYRSRFGDGSPGWRQMKGVRLPYEERSHPVLLTVITDISEQKEASFQLGTIVKHSPAGIALFELGDTLRMRYANDELLRMRGCTDKHLTGLDENDPLQDVHPEDREAFMRELRRSRDENKTAELSYRVLAPNGGDVRYLTVRMAPLYKTPQGAQVFMGLYLDQTVRRNYEIQFEAVVEHSPVGLGIMEYGENPVVRYRNKRFMEILGIQEENLSDPVFKTAQTHCHPRDLPMLEKALRSVMDGTDGTAEYTFRWRGQGGSYNRIIKGTGVTIERFGAQGMLLITVMDVTEQISMEQDLIAGRNRLKCAFDQTSAVLWEVDVKKRTFCVWDTDTGSPKAGTEFVNVPESLLEGGWVRNEYHERFEAFFHKLLSGCSSDSMSCIVRYFRNNEFGWCNLSYQMLHDEEGRPYKAIGVSKELPNIFSEKTRMEQEERYFEVVKDNLVACMRFNLTQNAVEQVYVHGQLSVESPGRNLSAYCEQLGSRVCGAGEAKRLEGMIWPAALKSNYDKGVDWTEAEYRRSNKEGEVRWCVAVVVTMTEPVSGDLHGFWYVRDIDVRKRWETALPVSARVDVTTRLFDVDTMRAFVQLALGEVQEDEERFCCLALVKIIGLEELTREMGLGFKSRLLYATGRLFRVYCDGDTLVGQGGDDMLAVLVPEAATEQEALWMLNQRLRAVQEAAESTGLVSQLRFAAGIAAGKIGVTRSDELFQQAKAVCEEGCLWHVANAKSLPVEPVPVGTENERENFRVQERYLRLHCHQTGLLNRQAYYDMLEKSKTDGLFSVGTLFADINGLTLLNRDFGNRYGDVLIRFLADSLRSHFPEHTIYRISGDEFVVVQKGVTHEKFLAQCAAVQKTWTAAYPGSISVGWTWDDRISSLQKLVDHAQELMMSQKEAHHRQVQSPQGGFHNDLRRWLVNGTEEKRFQVFLQPKMETATGRIMGAEALVRYFEKDGHITTPGKFISQLEREHLIAILDFYIFEETLYWLQEMVRRGKQPVPVSVNFSRGTLLDPSTFDTVQRIQRKFPDLQQFIEIEITETVSSMERATAARACQQFRKAGYKLLLDDYGSEYSGVYILSALQFDVIKIDKTVIDDITSSRMSRLIVENIMRICKEMDMQCVAEGVETPEQQQVLKKLGCHSIQGYYVDKPLPAEEFIQQYLKDT